jgi:hypothetical protein
MMRQLIRGVLTLSIALLLLSSSVQPGRAAPFCMMTSVNLGEPVCAYRTWAQCRANLGGLGDYCYPNTLAGYIFDLRDPANPRVVSRKPPRQPGR